MMRTSIILSTYNQPEWLAKTFMGYERQQAGPHEIVVADDGSTDSTREVIESFRRRGKLSIQHVWQEDDGFQKTRILNKAIDAASGDYLIFSDGDCIPRKDYVAVHQRLARPNWFLAGGLVRLPLATSQQINEDHIASGECFRPGWLWRQGGMRLHRLLKLASRGGFAELCDRFAHVLPDWAGSNSSCWKKDALAVGGFDERMQYWREDHEFGQRLVHLGVRARQIRYSAITLHLDHGRSYVTQAMKDLNEAILAETRANRKVVTEFGMRAAA